MVQQPHKDLLSLNQIKVLNTSRKNERESLLTISLEKILTMGAIKDITIVIGNKIDRVSKY